MPNWCNNTLVLRHDNPEMIKRAENAFAEGKFCQEFVPCPAELLDTTSPNRDEKQADALLEKYGYADWYAFNTSEWGTKWDFGSSDGINSVTDNELIVYFDSAWSPPITLMEKLEQQGFSVVLDYYECGMGFVGRYADGCDETYDAIPGECPEDMDEMWCITENAEMNEEIDED